MNCKHGAVIVSPDDFILTDPEMRVVCCDCCGAAVRIASRIVEPPRALCGICTPPAVVSISVADEPTIGEGL